MPITVECECGKQLKAPDQAAGKKVRCPSCGAIRDVPAASPSSLTPGPGLVSDPPRPFPVRPTADPAPKTPTPPSAPPLDLDDDLPAKQSGGTTAQKKPVADLDEDEDAPQRPNRRGRADRQGRRTQPAKDRGLLVKLLIVGAVGLIGCVSLGGAIAYIGYVLSEQNADTEEK